MTDPKADRSKAPSHQADPDVFLAWCAAMSGVSMYQAQRCIRRGCQFTLVDLYANHADDRRRSQLVGGWCHPIRYSGIDLGCWMSDQ